MRKTYILLVSIFLFSCNGLHNVEEARVTLQFSHNWDGDVIDNSTFGSFLYQTENGQQVQIDRLRYLVSRIKLVGNTGVDFLSKDYNLVDVGDGSGFTISVEDVIPGTYNISFQFGFSDADNLDGIYQDLNSASFNVPSQLGGGYHYMQLDGKYKDIKNNDVNFNYHVIRAINLPSVGNPQFIDTSFDVNLGTVNIKNDATIEIKMNVSEWFKNPNQWDLNTFDVNLMSNFTAQLQMNQNGKSVFSLGQVTQ